jgi:hypothetical protein
MKIKKNKILNYHVWSDDIHNIILDDIEKHCPRIVNIFAAEEHEMNGIWSSSTGYHSYISKFVKRGIEVNFIFGAASQDFYDNRYHFPDKKIYTHLWPTYFLCFSLSSMYHSVGLSNMLPKHNFKFAHPFISLNNRPHGHRCMFMDLMARHDLIDKGKVSWHGDNSAYGWQWFKPQRNLVLDESFLKTGNSFFVPKEWDNCFLHVVSECSINRVYYSEKTWMPILNCKPFISQSHRGFYKIFKSLGFELYDEIFDYSFDDEVDDLKRTDAIMENVKKIIDQDTTELYRSIKPKILHNFNRAIEIARSPNFVPNVIKNSRYATDKYTAIKDVQRPNGGLDNFVRNVNEFMKD